MQPLRLLRGPGRNGALPEALRPGGCGRPGQTPSPSPLDVLFQTRFQEGLQRACSKPSKRRAEGHTAFTVHDAKERRVGPAESSVEPQLCLADTCMCISTHQCPTSHMCPPSPNHYSLKMFASAHPGSEPRAQLLVKMKKMINIKKEQNLIRRCLVGVRSGAQPTTPVRPGTTAEPATLGPLAGRAQQWRACGTSDWVIKTVTAGYRLQFASTPPRFNGILQSQARGEKAQVLQEEITSLRNKGAIRVVPPEKNQSGFYLRYFLVPKKGGGLRPILDLRALNRYMRQYSFRMLTHAALIRFVRPGGWFTSIDLRDAYFHIPIYPPHRKYLRFAFQGVTYEYLVLPFGLSLSPRVIVKCTEAAVHTDINTPHSQPSVLIQRTLVCPLALRFPHVNHVSLCRQQAPPYLSRSVDISIYRYI